MNWTEQTQELLRSWTETQKQLWEGWSGAAGSTSSPGQHSPGGLSAWLQPWQEATRRGLAGVPREVAERLFAGEQVFMRFAEAALGVLKTMAPQLDAGEDWADLLRRYLAQLKEEMTRTPAPWYTAEATAAVMRDLPELWRLYLQEAEKVTAPWVHSLGEARGHLGEAMAGDSQAAVHLLNVFLDTFETTAGRLTAGPAIGFTRELQEKVARAFETWVDLRRTEAEFRVALVNAGFRALEDLVRELVERGERGEKIESLRALFDLWVATAERTYFEIASTESFAEIQGRLVNAAMAYRIREREVADAVAKGWHLPTRGELDDAYRHLHELRAEVRALRRELDLLKKAAAPAPTPEQKPAQAPARKGRARKQTAKAANKEG